MGECTYLKLVERSVALQVEIGKDFPDEKDEDVVTP
jgi:hypothetical protein